MGQVSLHVELLAHTPQPENTIAMGAKLCYSASSIDTLREKIAAKDQQAFLQKLMDMGHLSPVEHSSFTFGVEGVSRVLLAQATRHRLASFSVQSQRYVNQAAEGGFSYIVPPAIEALGEESLGEYRRQMEQMSLWSQEWVQKLGNAGEKSNEDARFVLPNAAETKFVVTMNARELQHFFGVRCCSRAQWEIRALAWAMLGHCLAAAPSLFGHSGPGCVGGPCPEGQKSCGRAKEMRALAGELAAYAQAHGKEKDYAAQLTGWVREHII